MHLKIELELNQQMSAPIMLKNLLNHYKFK